MVFFLQSLYNQVMEIKNIHKYIWLELAIWLFIVIFAVGAIRIHNYNSQKHLATYQIFMPDVDGLIVGSPVKYMGVQVGYVSKIKIISSEVYVKFVITDEDFKLPKGVIATVEFNGMGGSKSLEVYPPTIQSIASGKIISVSDPVRLNDAVSLMNEMFDKIDSIISRVSFFAKETGTFDIKDSGLDLLQMEKNVNITNKIIKNLSRGGRHEQRVNK